MHHNNIDRHLSVEEAGGSKFKYTTGLIVRRCLFHDNWGYGIWYDISNDNATIANNIVEGHERAGIFWEISGGPVTITENTIRRAGLAYNDWVFGGGITTSTSSGPITVTRNLIEDCPNGITFLNQGGRDNDPCSDPINGVRVTDNIINRSGQSGWNKDDQYPDLGIIEWDRNQYNDCCAGTASCGYENPNPAAGQSFRTGLYGSVTFTQWRAQGHDQNGSISGCTK